MSKGEPQLTPAANELLGEVTEQFRTRILREGSRIQGSEDTEQIVRMRSIRDALESVGEDGFAVNGRTQRLAMMQAAFTAIGAAILVVGTALFLKLSDGRTITTVSAVMAVLSGSAFAATLFAVAKRNRIKRSNLQAVSRKFVVEFDDLARRSMLIASEVLEADVDRISFTQISYALRESNVWKAHDVAIFRRLLALRNAIVHESNTAVDTGDLAAGFAQIRPLYRKLMERSLADLQVDQAISSMALDYEKAVGEALRRVVGRDAVTGVSDSAFDFLVELSGGSVLVAVKYTRAPLSAREILRIVDRDAVSGSPGRLVVTNHELSDEIRKLNAEDYSSTPFEVIRWMPSSGENLMQRVLARLASASSAAVLNPRFELYQDTDGKYRFRFKSVDGKILFVSNAFDLRRDALASVETLQVLGREATIEEIAGT